MKACPKVKAGVRGEEEDMMDIFSVGETSIVVSGPSLKVEANLIFWWHTSYWSQTVLVEKNLSEKLQIEPFSGKAPFR